MNRFEKNISIAGLAIAEAGLLYLDAIITIGVLVFDDTRVPMLENVSMLIMCGGDTISFIVSWLRPKIGGALLAATAIATLAMCLIVSDSHSLNALWFSGGIFWSSKVALALIFYKRLPVILGSEAL